MENIGKKQKIVIIGGVAAGPKIAAKLLRSGTDFDIDLYTEEDMISYSACGLPYYVEGLIEDSNRLIVRTPQQFEEKGAVILGISKDSVASHKRFEEKQGLTFTLLSDPELKVIQAYDVWKEKKNYGKVSMGVVRTTYLIDENGVIVKAFDKVKAAENPQQMLEELS